MANESEKIVIRKVDIPKSINDGLVYGAFNQFGTPVGKRFRTAEECRKSFEEQGFRNIVMPQKSDRER